MPEPEKVTISVFVPDYQIKAVGDYRYRTQTTTSGLFQYSSASAQTLSAAYNMSMAILGAATTGVATVVITGVQIAVSLLAMNLSAQAKIYHHYVTTYSIGDIQYSDGLWTPYVQIAQRKRYKHYWGWAHRASDESPVQDTFDYNPPTYSPIETLTKSHFADQTWIRNKAFECYYAGTYYYDVSF